jgi:hypothetical protein
MAVVVSVTQEQIVEYLYRLAPKFGASEWATLVTVHVEAARAAHTANAWVSNEVYRDAMACWALHYLVQDEIEESSPTFGLAAGPVASIRTGEESVSFAARGSRAGPADDDDFRGTKWGRRYLKLRGSRPDAHLFSI